MKSFATIDAALQYVVKTLIPQRRTYIVNLLAPTSTGGEELAVAQVVAQHMIFEDRSSGLTLNLPFDAQSHQLAHLVEFLESSVSDLCDEYRWDGTPCFAFRFGTDVEIALQVIRRVLTEVYGYTEPNNFKCEVHDAGVIE